MSEDEELTTFMMQVRDLGIAARDQEVFVLLEAADDALLIRALPAMATSGIHEGRFTAYRDAIQSILERRLSERLRQTMIDLDATAGKLQKAVFWATVVGAALTGVGACAALVVLWRP